MRNGAVCRDRSDFNKPQLQKTTAFQRTFMMCVFLSGMRTRVRPPESWRSGIRKVVHWCSSMCRRAAPARLQLRSSRRSASGCVWPVVRSLFDETDLVEIEDAENFPGERLVVCRNPLPADERARKREELLRATEAKLDAVVKATQRTKNRLKGQDEIGLRVGRTIDKYKMRKHFELTITDDRFSYSRREDSIAAESWLAGLYVVRTSVTPEVMDADTVVPPRGPLWAHRQRLHAIYGVHVSAVSGRFKTGHLWALQNRPGFW
jgi:hypothetical protein